jgi:anti-anti-sigma factor
MTTCYYEDDHVFARVTGDLNMLNIGTLVEQVTQYATEKETWRIIMDFSGVSIVDSAAIGSLVKLARQAQGEGGDVLLACPNAHLLEVLYYSKLEKTLKPFLSIDKALHYSLHGEPAPEDEKPGEEEAQQPRH